MKSPSLFPEQDLEDELAAALAAAEAEKKNAIRSPPRAQAPTSSPGQNRSEKPGEDPLARVILDKMFATPSITDAISLTVIECSRAGFHGVSVGVLGTQNLYVTAFDGSGRKISASGAPAHTIDVLRDLIIKLRASP